MPSLPTSLALTSIADGSPIVAADHRNNYAAIQLDMNTLLTILGAGTAGDVLTGVGTTMQYAKPPGYEIGYDQITAPVTVSATVEATGTTVISCAAHTFDGGPVLAHFFCPSLTVTNASDFMQISLFEGATQIGRLIDTRTESASGQQLGGLSGWLRFTPSAASHTYSVTAVRLGANGTITAGAGGAAAYVPAFVRFTKV